MTDDAKLTELREAMVRAADLLDGVGEQFWANRIRAAGTGALDPAEILSWFGGMGSFNDLLIAQVNGHRVPSDGENAVNDRLSELRIRMYRLAADLKS